MRVRRTVDSTHVFTLPGGTEDNDLWAELTVDSNENPVICSTWQPSDEERQRIANGENLKLIIWGTQQPPVALTLTDTELRGSDADPDGIEKMA